MQLWPLGLISEILSSFSIGKEKDPTSEEVSAALVQDWHNGVSHDLGPYPDTSVPWSHAVWHWRQRRYCLWPKGIKILPIISMILNYLNSDKDWGFWLKSSVWILKKKRKEKKWILRSNQSSQLLSSWSVSRHSNCQDMCNLQFFR